MIIIIIMMITVIVIVIVIINLARESLRWGEGTAD